MSLIFPIIFPIITLIFPIIFPIISTQTIIFPIIFPIIFLMYHLFLYYFLLFQGEDPQILTGASRNTSRHTGMLREMTDKWPGGPAGRLDEQESSLHQEKSISPGALNLLYSLFASIILIISNF